MGPLLVVFDYSGPSKATAAPVVDEPPKVVFKVNRCPSRDPTNHPEQPKQHSNSIHLEVVEVMEVLEALW